MAYRMMAVVREIEERGRADLMDYLCAFQYAAAVMGEDIGKPLGKCSNAQHSLKLLTIAMAASAIQSRYL